MPNFLVLDPIGLVTQFRRPDGSALIHAIAGATPSNNCIPFTFGYGAASRYQQVYSAAGFALSPGATLTIAAIAFRPAVIYGAAYSLDCGPTTVSLSTTTRGVGSLSADLDANVGGDKVVVRSAPLTLASAFTGPANGPKDFDVVLAFSTPFAYSPDAGNLLLDVSMTAAPFNARFLDAIGGLAAGSNPYSSRAVAF